jgi:hypothetical protein
MILHGWTVASKHPVPLGVCEAGVFQLFEKIRALTDVWSVFGRGGGEEI